MTYQLNICDYLPVAERLPAIYGDYRPGRKGGAARWQTARAQMIAAPSVLEDPAAHAATMQAVTEYLELDLSAAQERMIGREVKWTKSQRKGGLSVTVTLTGTVYATIPAQADAIALLPPELREIKPSERRKHARLPVLAKGPRYLIVQAGPDGPFYVAASAQRVNKANLEKLLASPTESESTPIPVEQVPAKPEAEPEIETEVDGYDLSDPISARAYLEHLARHYKQTYAAGLERVLKVRPPQLAQLWEWASEQHALLSSSLEWARLTTIFRQASRQQAAIPPEQRERLSQAADEARSHPEIQRQIEMLDDLPAGPGSLQKGILTLLTELSHFHWTTSVSVREHTRSLRIVLGQKGYGLHSHEDCVAVLDSLVQGEDIESYQHPSENLTCFRLKTTSPHQQLDPLKMDAERNTPGTPAKLDGLQAALSLTGGPGEPRELPRARACRAGKKGKVHLVECGAEKAICTFRPGYSSTGWRETDAIVDCPKCVLRVDRFQIVGYLEGLADEPAVPEPVEPGLDAGTITNVIAEPEPSKPGPAAVALVACCGQKEFTPKPAGEFYCSDLFKKCKAYADMTCGSWFILSALHGLVDPGRELERYNLSLDDLTLAQRQSWSEGVAAAIQATIPADTTLVLLAGGKYVAQLAPLLEQAGYPVTLPLKGKAIGLQKQWLKEQIEGSPESDPPVPPAPPAASTEPPQVEPDQAAADISAITNVIAPVAEPQEDDDDITPPARLGSASAPVTCIICQGLGFHGAAMVALREPSASGSIHYRCQRVIGHGCFWNPDMKTQNWYGHHLTPIGESSVVKDGLPPAVADVCLKDTSQTEPSPQTEGEAQSPDLSGPCLYTGCKGRYQPTDDVRWACSADPSHLAWLHSPEQLVYRSAYGTTYTRYSEYLAGKTCRIGELEPAGKLEATAVPAATPSISSDGKQLSSELTPGDETVVLPAYLETYGTTPEHCDCRARKFSPGKPCKHMSAERERQAWGPADEMTPQHEADMLPAEAELDARCEAPPELDGPIPGSACAICKSPMLRHSVSPPVWRCSADDYHRLWVKKEGKGKKAVLTGVWMSRIAGEPGTGVCELPAWAK
ncbi:MAG: hypothetical protein CVV27_09720 [Candidatus Melainabacteria bacterium HGW-Melainabacteria-1]|nr:MAG: hypothetical protein CVV27_09720 [Candidatus Melainabacteria bacterium HGW-Melainabacteria-1]